MPRLAIHRPFGTSGDTVTAIALGGGELDRFSYSKGIETVGRALDLGIGYFDTSPMYCNGLSQKILGEALEGREEPHLLATKLGYLSHPEAYRSPAALRSQLEKNLRRLRRGYVDVLQIHEADWACWWTDGAQCGELISIDNFYDFDNAPIMHVMREAYNRGLCRFIGITGNNADRIAQVLSNLEVDTCLVAYHYDLLFRGVRRSILPLVDAKGVAFIAAAILQSGNLAQPHPEWLSSPPEWMTADLRKRFQKLYSLQEHSGMSMASLATRYLLADQQIATILIGAASPAEIEDVVLACQEGPLPAELHQSIEELGTSERDSPWIRSGSLPAEEGS